MPRDAVPISARLFEGLGALGVPVPALCQELGIHEGAPPDSLTTEQLFELFRAIERVAPRRDVGLVLGGQAITGGYGVAASVALQAPTVLDAMRAYARYKRLTCPEMIYVELEPDGEASVRVHWVLATSEVPRALVDSALASFAAIAREGTRGAVGARRVELSRRAADAELLRGHFGCRVVFGAPIDRIVFDGRAMATPLVTADAAAFARVVPGLERELAGAAPRRSLLLDVRVAIARAISGGARPSVEQVALRLRLSARTLQRRLGEEQTTYQAELDTVRRLSARRMLANTELPPSDIAILLGFDEPNSFARAFRAWERTTPTRWRERRHAL